MRDSQYFSHDYDAADDPKMGALLQDCGNLGYGIYWRLIEMLYRNDGSLDLAYPRLCFGLREKEEIVKQVIENFGLFYFPGGGKKLASHSVDRRLKKRKEKSELAKASAAHRWSDANAMRTHSTNDANAMLYKGKERKGKERTDLLSADQPREKSQHQIYTDWYLAEVESIVPQKYPTDAAYRKAVSAGYQRFSRAAKQILAFAGGDPDKAKAGTKAIGLWLQRQNLTWGADTVAKWFNEWARDPKEFEKKNGKP